MAYRRRRSARKSRRSYGRRKRSGRSKRLRIGFRM